MYVEILATLGGFLLRKFDFFNFYMVSSCSILFTDFGTVFVFALGLFFTPSVFFTLGRLEMAEKPLLSGQTLILSSGM